MPRSSRTVRPTDLVALVAFDGRVYRNEARTWDKLEKPGDGPSPIETGIAAIEPLLSFATRRQAWISVNGLTLQGLVSARRLHTRAALEVDTLICAMPDPEEVCIDLLSAAVRGAARSGAHRLFLRLDSESPLVNISAKAGFVPYCRESVYFRGSRPESVGGVAGLQRAEPADDHEVFRLYCRAVPEVVRRYEAVTLQEWQALRPGGRKREFVLYEEGRLNAWVRLSSEGGYLHLRLLHSPELESVEGLLGAVFASVGARQRLYCAVPHYDFQLQQALEACGFGLIAEHSVLVHRTLKMVGELDKKEEVLSQPVVTA